LQLRIRKTEEEKKEERRAGNRGEKRKDKGNNSMG